MVVKMIKRCPSPSVKSRKFQVCLTVQALEGLLPPSSGQDQNLEGLLVDVKWKGPKGSIFPRRSLKRLRTIEKHVTGNGIVRWEEKSDFDCNFMQAKNNSGFLPWDVHFVVLKATHQGEKPKIFVIGAAVRDIVNFICASEHTERTTRISISGAENEAFLVGWKDEGLLVPDISEGLDFGDEKFNAGSWEMEDFINRDGHMKLSANVFFASIDQRNERAAGESACTALVAVRADWLQGNPNRTPIKAEFDSLIREGSAEWRRLWDDETYTIRFPNGHFDLDTVLEAKVRPLRVSSERSFVGFFQPEGVADMCNFRREQCVLITFGMPLLKKPEVSKLVVVLSLLSSWNDHFFILKVDAYAFSIIDTLGERLYEGCDQAYIIRFDKHAKLCHVPDEQFEGKEMAEGYVCPVAEFQSLETCSPDLSVSEKQLNTGEVMGEEECSKSGPLSGNIEPIYKGEEACKYFLKEFFAAVPLRELEVDLKKGLLGTLPLHRRLQIEFHFMLLDT